MILTLPATLMDEVKDAVEQEEDSGMNLLVGFSILFKADGPRSLAEFSRQKTA